MEFDINIALFHAIIASYIVRETSNSLRSLSSVFLTQRSDSVSQAQVDVLLYSVKKKNN